jgi:hypothetical protein
MKGFFNSRMFRQGSVATAITVFVVAIVVVINFVSTALTDRYGLVLDLTPTKLMSITDETRGYIAGLDKDVTIYVLSKEETLATGGDYYVQANEILKRYDTESDRITLEYMDIVADPTFAQNYPTLDLGPTSILVTSGDRVRDLTPYDLYETQMDEQTYQEYIVASQAEQTLTSAILAVTSDKTVNVAVINDHNEEDITPFRDLLMQNNYLVDEVSILMNDIDPMYDVVIIAAPVFDFDEEQLQRLDRFLENNGEYGKTLLYFASSDQVETPALDMFLADWGVGVGAGLVFETDPAMHNPVMPYVAQVEYVDADQEFSAGVQASGLTVMGGYARPLSLLFETDYYIGTSTLLQFSAGAGIATPETETIEDIVPSGPIPYLSMGRHISYDGTTPLISNVLVAGSTAIINPEFLSYPSLANSEYMLTLFDKLTDKEEGVRIQSKALTNESMNIDAASAYTIGILLTIIFPLVVLISGIIIWARRRHR